MTAGEDGFFPALTRRARTAAGTVRGVSVPTTVRTPSSRPNPNAARSMAAERLKSSFASASVVGSGIRPFMTAGPKSSRSKSSEAPKWKSEVFIGR